MKRSAYEMVQDEYRHLREMGVSHLVAHRIVCQRIYEALETSRIEQDEAVPFGTRGSVCKDERAAHDVE